MTVKDTLEIGLKENAPFRKDNLPESQVRGPEIPTGPGRSPEVPAAREDVDPPKRRRRRRAGRQDAAGPDSAGAAADRTGAGIEDE